MTAAFSSAYLFGRLSLVEQRVRELVAARRATDPSPDDAFRGLYVSDEHADLVLAQPPAHAGTPLDLATARLAEVEAAADQAQARGGDVRLRRLVGTFGLTALDVELLLVALAPDLDSRFERLYGYLNDDVTRRRASVGLALELSGAPLTSAPARARLSPGGPLVAGGLLVVEDGDRPLPTRSLRVPDRVAAHLLGDDTADARLAHLLVLEPIAAVGDVAGLARALAAGAELVYLRERPGSAGRALAVAGLAAAGRPAVVVDLERLGGDEDLGSVSGAAGREARLRGAGLVAGPVDGLLGQSGSAAALRSFAELPGVRVITGRVPWDPLWSREAALVLDAPVPTVDERRGLWQASIDAGPSGGPSSADLERDLGQFRLGPEQVSRAAGVARLVAAAAGGPLATEHLRVGARAQHGGGLERLARHIQPRVSWTDLVLPPATMAYVREVAVRARQRDRVLDEWGMRPGGGRGRGIAALFAGESGTGKTMSAEVIAGELGLDLYAVNLATVVDKYVGETEKNLERIFSEADGSDAILLFDEADALFGKRSEVSDARDRYANIEVAYLLQRMESFDGLAILATNLRSNVDDAFARRLDAIVEFPLPDAEHRRTMWHQCLGDRLPRAADVDLDFCADAFELSGGNIRSIALTAAYTAAESGRPVSMGDLVRAIHREYRKLGRLSVASEFGRYFELLSA